MKEGLEHRDNLIGLLDGEGGDDLGRMLTPIKDYLNKISSGSKLHVVCEIGDAEIGMIPVGVAKTPEEAMELAHKLAGEVNIEMIEGDRSLTVSPSINRFQIVEVMSYL